MTSDLKALRDILVKSIDTIVDISETKAQPFPSLNDPIDFSEFAPTSIRNNPQVLDAANLIVAAAYQLICTVRPPVTTLTLDALRWTLPAALGVVIETNVAEIVRAAGPKGAHVNDIAVKNGTHPKKLGRVLRTLATNHWFKEVAPDVFAHNLLSSLLDTGKNYKDIQGPGRINKHENTPGLTAMAGLCADEGLKAGAFLTDSFMDPTTAMSEEPQDAGIQRATGIKLPLWELYESAGQELRAKRFPIVMAGASKLQPPEAILTGFDWTTVPKGGLIVDVGGSLGHVSLEIANIRPDLVIAIEDRAPVLEQAKKFWQGKLPSHITSNKVKFIATDFFKPQPYSLGNPDVYILRQITHDWSDKLVITIFKHLRAAAKSTTKLLIVDSILDYACEVPDNSQLVLPGLKQPVPPAPLLANLGAANILSFSLDVLMMSQLNAGERTIGSFLEVTSASGWKIVQVNRSHSNSAWWPTIVAVPVPVGLEAESSPLHLLSLRSG